MSAVPVLVLLAVLMWAGQAGKAEAAGTCGSDGDTRAVINALWLAPSSDALHRNDVPSSSGEYAGGGVWSGSAASAQPIPSNPLAPGLTCVVALVLMLVVGGRLRARPSTIHMSPPITKPGHRARWLRPINAVQGAWLVFVVMRR
jgi:hypothetical protein